MTAAPVVHPKLSTVEAKQSEPETSEVPRIRVEFVEPRSRHEDDEELSNV
jgi:hypothetical protein